MLRRKAVEIASGGDVQMLKFLLSREFPRERSIKIELPSMSVADDAAEALGAVTRAVSEGKISPREGAALATLINSFARAIELADIDRKLDALQSQLAEGRRRSTSGAR